MATTIFFFLPFSTMTLPQFHSIFFPSHFRQCHCHNYQKKISFFFPISVMALSQLVFLARTGNLGRGISITALPKFKIFLSPTFPLSLSVVAKIQNLSLSNFSSFSLLLLLNFGNTVTKILSLFSFCQLN